MQDQDLQLIAKLLTGQRWASLASLHEGSPESSQVAFAMEAGFSGVLLHLSTLATHTRNALADPRVSLGVSEQDSLDAELDPQTLARLSLHGQLSPLDKHGPEYDSARALYLSRLPQAAPLFDFSDFQLFRLQIESGRMVGGFGRARGFGADILPLAAQHAFTG